jgi:hypothetical protein
MGVSHQESAYTVLDFTQHTSFPLLIPDTPVFLQMSPVPRVFLVLPFAFALFPLSVQLRAPPSKLPQQPMLSSP